MTGSISRRAMFKGGQNGEGGSLGFTSGETLRGKGTQTIPAGKMAAPPQAVLVSAIEGSCPGRLSPVTSKTA